MKTRSSAIARILLTTAVTVVACATAAIAGGDWNDAGIAWQPYDAGLIEAKTTNKPVCLVFYTDWCPHCTNYAKVFHDPTVVETSKKLVMIRINKDQDAATSAKHAPDGGYIPRTFFLKPDGTLLDEITEQRPNYKYFYDENNPKSLLRSMNAVLAMTFELAAGTAVAPAAEPAVPVPPTIAPAPAAPAPPAP